MAEEPGKPQKTSRFQLIEKRLAGDPSAYNKVTRRKNRIYLKKYVKDKSDVTDKEFIVKRRKEAENRLKKLNELNAQQPLAEQTLEENDGVSQPPEICAKPSERIYKLQEVPGDGNCFFHALYGAAKNYPDESIIRKVFGALEADETYIEDAKRGAHALREGFANIVQRDLPDQAGVFEQFKKYISDRKPTNSVNLFEAHVGEMADVAKKELFRTIPTYTGGPGKTKRDFYKQLADIIRENKRYVDAFEYENVKELLNGKGIVLENVDTKPKIICKEYKPVLFLKRVGGNHYDYWKPAAAAEPMGPEAAFPGEKQIAIDVEIKNNAFVVKKEDMKDAEDEKSSETSDIGDCIELFDPCSREPIANLATLEQRVKDIKRQRMADIDSKMPFPEYVKNRLDLLLFILNSEEKPSEKLLQYTNNGQLYESYWDIVFTFGLIGEFPITDHFNMYNGKIETLVNIDSEAFMNKPFEYLSSKKVNEGSKSGASDITFVYKKNKFDTENDLCSSDPTIQVTDSCRRERTVEKVSGAERPLFYFCSSKYFNKDNTKGVDKFDIQNIYTAAKVLNTEYDRKIILLVKDKSAVEEKLRKAIRKYISDEASYVFGMNDLFSSLTSFYDFIHSKHKSASKITKEILSGILNLKSSPKPILRLRLHQYIATYKICDAIKNFYKTKISNKFLVGIVPRGGKTFIAGGIIDTLNPKRVVVLLGAKSETLSQFKKDLFEEFQNFQQYECIDVVNVDSITAIDPSKKYIFIMSVELYKQAETTRTLLQELKAGVNRADLFICDEAHLKQTTSRAVRQMERGTLAVPEVEEEDISDETEESELKQLDKQIQADVPVVYMTGTYIKPLKAFAIPDENVIIWDYQDIQQAKELSANEEYFKENFGELYDRALTTCISYGENYETIQQQYQKFPELYLLSTQFTPDAKSAFLKQAKGGFPTISHLFEVRVDFNPETTPPERWYTGFTNPKGMLRLLNYLAPPSQSVELVDGIAVEPISSVLKSVDLIAQRIGDRLGYFTSEFVTHSQLWFLPHMQKNPLYKRMCALAGAIFQSSWFRKHFHIVGVSSSVKWNIPGSEQNSIQIRATDGSDSCGTFSWACPTGEKSLKQCLIDQEAFARQKGKGLIILAQNMLHLGISLPCVDIVVLLDVGEKVDERIQKMYRALTESTNKKGGYIIDMNYLRTVTAIMNYQITAEKSRKGKKQVYANDIKKVFNKVLDIFSIDIDKPIFGTREERAKGNSEIQKTTIPELEKIFHSAGKKKGDSMMLEDAGTALNTNIKDRKYI